MEKHKGKKISGGSGSTARGGRDAALDKREQAFARKRELLEKSRKSR